MAFLQNHQLNQFHDSYGQGYQQMSNLELQLNQLSQFNMPMGQNPQLYKNPQNFRKITEATSETETCIKKEASPLHLMKSAPLESETSSKAIKGEASRASESLQHQFLASET